MSEKLSRAGRASSSRRSTIPLIRSSSRGTTLPNRSRKFRSSNLRSRCRLNVSSEVSGFLISWARRSEEHTSELQSHHDLVCRLLLEKKKILRKKDIRLLHRVVATGVQ